MNERGLFKGIILLFLITLSTVAIVIATETSVPLGPDLINVSNASRYHNITGPRVEYAEAGNVTYLYIESTRVTEAWQGYYGNITGTIVLKDANNYTFYDWDLPDPKGEIFASNGTDVRWNKIYCMNVSHERQAVSTGNGIPHTGGDVIYNTNMSQIEWDFGINDTDMDGLNETFNDTYEDDYGIWVGNIHIWNESGCSMAHPYRNGIWTDDWEELLLSDNTSLIFTAIIRQNQIGYRGGQDRFDFQMLVLENGHIGHEDIVTPYYFYVELS